jgi:hypothetical protein
LSQARKIVLLLAASACACLALMASAAPASAAVSTVKVFPRTAGIQLVYGGRTYRTDSAGLARLPAGPEELQRRLRVKQTRLGPRIRATFGRVYVRRGRVVVTLSFYYLVQLSYINLQGSPVDSSIVESTIVKGIQGKHYTFRGDVRRWVQGSRVVTNNSGTGFRLKEIDYGVLRAGVEKSNVVNSGQQRFLPSKTNDVRVRLLLYSARFQTRDALFGFPLGSAIELHYPSGRVERHDLDDKGRAMLRSLPRGAYEVKVDAPGFSFTRPVSLSRNQEVKLEVLSFLDIGLALFVLAAFLIGLPLIQRPHLVSRTLRRRRNAVRNASRPTTPTETPSPERAPVGAKRSGG